jgi:hypothetical protein
MLARTHTNGFQKPLELQKRHVPRGFRKAYILGWNQDCENLYQEYNTNHDRATANRLLEETVESTNLIHLSDKRGACLVLIRTQVLLPL